MFLFIMGLIIGLAWGAGGVLLIQELQKEKKQKIYRESKPVLMRRMRVLRDEHLN